MSRRLVIVMATMTALIILAFVVPLAIVVRNNQMSDQISSAEASASSLAAFIDNGSQPDEIQLAVDRLDADEPDFILTVYDKDGPLIGEPISADEQVQLGFDGIQTEVRKDGGVIVYVPNNGPFDQASEYVVRLEAPASVLRGNLRRFFIALGISTLLAVALAGVVGVFAARSISRPTKRLTGAARQLQAGNLDTRVEESGPPELRELAETLNVLAGRIEELLERERESTADLAHRLRTPVTALHLEIEALPDSPESRQLMDRVRRLEATLSKLIGEMRRGTAAAAEGASADLASVSRDRIADWAEVATDRGRTLEADIAAHPLVVAASKGNLEAAIDVLLDNGVTHTPSGARVRVSVREDDECALLLVEDDGPGLPDTLVAERGVSEGSGTGLGLDIARATVERAGGTLDAGRSELGGAQIALRFPMVAGR